MIDTGRHPDGKWDIYMLLHRIQRAESFIFNPYARRSDKLQGALKRAKKRGYVTAKKIATALVELELTDAGRERISKMRQDRRRAAYNLQAEINAMREEANDDRH